MNNPSPYRIVLGLADTSTLDGWIRFASAFATPSPDIRIVLCGLVTVPEGTSLSEGARAAQAMREEFDKAAAAVAAVQDEVRVFVDYEPMGSLLEAMRGFGSDLLIVEWNGPGKMTGGLTTEALLRGAPCDAVLIARAAWDVSGPVLLSLRGGPNLSLATRVAEVLAQDAKITLFHALEGARPTIPGGGFILPSSPTRVHRTVTASGTLMDLLLAESAGHQAIIMGAGLYRLPAPGEPGTSAFQRIFEQTTQPLILVKAFQPEEIAFHRPRDLGTRPESLSTRVDRWFAENTFHSSEFADLRSLVAMKEKQGLSISLGLPALNEEATVGQVIRTIQHALMDEVPLLDEIVLIDSNSTDRTVEIAQEAGIRVFRHPEILADEVGSVRGKGEALWKSLHVLSGDLIVWIDTDITNIHPRFVYGLLGPLLKRPDVQYVKGFYQRPLKTRAGSGKVQAQGGGRVTELVARPMLNLFYPELSGIAQPLSGEYAGRRTALESVPFFSGYGVETGLLLDLHERFGLSGMAQSDLEERVHHSQSLTSLSKMSFTILQVFIARLEGRYGFQLLDKANTSMKMIIQEPERFALDIAEIGDVERPPMSSLPAYQQRHGALQKNRPANP